MFRVVWGKADSAQITLRPLRLRSLLGVHFSALQVRAPCDSLAVAPGSQPSCDSGAEGQPSSLQGGVSA